MKKLFISAAVIALEMLAVTAVNAENDYSFPYDADTGFSVSYTVVPHDELAEPEYAVGEIHQRVERVENIQYDTGVECILPNGSIMKMSLPWSYYRVKNADYDYFESDTIVNIYDNNGNFIFAKDTDEMFFPDGLGSDYVKGYRYKPVYYKGNFFFEQNSVVYLLDTDTFKFKRQFTKSYRGLYPFELDQKTIFESEGGYEMFPDNYVRNIDYSTANGMYRYCPVHIGLDDEDSIFSYSCDGIYYINIVNPAQGDNRIIHAAVNGDDCICITDDNTAYAYKIEDLKKCWAEYTKDVPYVYLNGVRLAFDTPPVIENGVTFMPLRYLLETAGAAVDWNEETRTALIDYNNISIEITENSDTAYINGAACAMGSCAKISDNKMMIPLRFVTEGLGFSVEWDQNENSIYINAGIDNINTFVSLLSPVEINDGGVMINGETVENLTAGGRTFVPVWMLKKYFSFSNDFTDENSSYKLELLDEADKDIDVTDMEFDSRLTDMTCIHRSDTSALINGVLIPIYTTKSNIDKLHSSNGNTINSGYYGFICIEEAADKIGCLHYEWIEEEKMLYIYISDDMVRYDEALKAILDAKNIKYDDEYNGGYFKDIDAAQKYSDNELSALVCAGVRAGIIRESDYPDRNLRSTRSISHIDLERMLSGAGCIYEYDKELKNVPVTEEELEEVLKGI